MGLWRLATGIHSLYEFVWGSKIPSDLGRINMVDIGEHAPTRIMRTSICDATINDDEFKAMATDLEMKGQQRDQ